MERTLEQHLIFRFTVLYNGVGTSVACQNIQSQSGLHCFNTCIQQTLVVSGLIPAVSVTIRFRAFQAGPVRDSTLEIDVLSSLLW